MISLGGLMAAGSIHAAYQPIIDLASGAPVAYEALLRGPPGSDAEFPARLFELAAAQGLQEELEWAGLEHGVTGALRAGMDRHTTLFVNVEGSSAGRPRSAAQMALLATAGEHLRVVFEVTERDLLARPRDLLLATDELQERGWGLAIDDVGLHHPEGVAAMSLVRPDVVKLDMALLDGPPTPRQASIGLAVQSYVEEYGGAVVAEGIETPAQLERAQVLGATLGQGYLFGHAAALPQPLPHPPTSVPLIGPRQGNLTDTPYEIAKSRLDFRIATKRVILPISMHLETYAPSLGPEVFVFATFQTGRYMTSASAARYAHLAQQCCLVAAYGIDLPDPPRTNVRSVNLKSDDRLAQEWVVVVISPHYAAALVGRDLGDDPAADMDRRFEFAVTHNRSLVAQMGTSLLARIDGGRSSVDHHEFHNQPLAAAG